MLARDAWLELRGRVIFWFSAAVLVVAGAMAAFPGLFTSLGPNERCDLRLSKRGPEPGALFGYDLQGCDYWSQIVHGARASIVIGVAVTVFALLISVVLGLIGGYYGGAIDALISRVTDVFFGIPFVLGATVILVAFPDHGIWAMTLVLVLLGWTTMTRLMRGQVIAVKDMEYVAAARALGAGDWRIMFRHILPNAFSPLLVSATLEVAAAILSEAGLSFLGLGVPPPAPSWGNMLNRARPLHILAGMPWMWIPPGLAVFVVVLSINFVGDGLRDALDPRQEKKDY